MVSRIAIRGIGVLGLVASYYLGSLPGKEGERAGDTGREPGRDILVRGEDGPERKKPRRGVSPGFGTVKLELLSDTHDPNRRLEILLELLKQSPTEGYGAIYLATVSGSEHERRLVLHTMFQRNSLASLQFVKDHDPGNLEFALDVGLKVDSELVAAWAGAAKVQTMDLADYEDSQIPDEKMDEWIAASREAKAGREVLEWTKDLPSGKPVVETVQEVVTMSAAHSDRGRYWLVNSKDTRARMRAAGDIGWESDDMGWEDFDQWLLDLPLELAEAALAGRLERLAAENPGNAELLWDTLDRYSQFYHLDQSYYLMAMRLLNQGGGDQATIGQMVSKVDDFELREQVELVAIDYYGESFSSSVSTSAETMASSFESSAGLEWASGIGLDRGRDRAIDSFIRSNPEAATALGLQSSASASRGAPGGIGRGGRP